MIIYQCLVKFQSIKCLININQKLINQINQKIKIELDQLNANFNYYQTIIIMFVIFTNYCTNMLNKIC